MLTVKHVTNSINKLALHKTLRAEQTAIIDAKIPASHCLWICFHKKYAHRYDKTTKFELPKYWELVAYDSDHGYLIFSKTEAFAN